MGLPAEVVMRDDMPEVGAVTASLSTFSGSLCSTKSALAHLWRGGYRRRWRCCVACGLDGWGLLRAEKAEELLTCLLVGLVNVCDSVGGWVGA